jgi:hypothetical protein
MRSMTDAARDRHLSAQRNIIEGMNDVASFPANVFRASWAEFYFFEPDILFSKEGLHFVFRLLNAEGSDCAILKSIPGEPSSRIDGSTEVLFDLADGSQANAKWESSLNSIAPNFSDFRCTSNFGLWYIYIERVAEIAVIALRKSKNVGRLRDEIGKIGGRTFSDLLGDVNSWVYFDYRLSKEWREQLLASYAVDWT